MELPLWVPRWREEGQREMYMASEEGVEREDSSLRF